MTATEEVCRLLDERGVEYEVDDAETVRVTRWRAYGDWVSFIEYDNGDTKFCIDARRLTPEQAIAATLGRGECHKVRVHEEIEDEMHCSECGRFLGFAGDIGALPYNFCPNCGRKVVDV